MGRPLEVKGGSEILTCELTHSGRPSGPRGSSWAVTLILRAFPEPHLLDLESGRSCLQQQGAKHTEQTYEAGETKEQDMGP